MANDIRFEFDEVSVAAIEKKLGAMKSMAPTVLKRALNDTAKDARKDLAKKAQETYAVKKSGLAKYARIQSASNGNLVAIIRIKDKPLPLAKKYFSVQGGHGPRGKHMKTTVIKGETHTWGARAFHNILGKSRHEGAAEFIGGDKEQPTRLHLKTLYTVSIPQMFGSKKRVYGVVEPNIQDNLRRNVERHIDVVLRG